MRPARTSRCPRSRRRGITILEVLIAATAVVLMMSLCAVSIQLLMKLNTDAQGRLSAAVNLERLAQRWRDDVHASERQHAAAGTQSAGNPAAIHLIMAPDHVVDFKSGDGEIVRTESRAGKVIRHDAFALGRGAVGRFGLRDEGSHTLAVLTVVQSSGKSRMDPPRPLEVVALQGKDRVRALAQEGEKPR
jgi:Tfp pilus assembly protein PilV